LRDRKWACALFFQAPPTMGSSPQKKSNASHHGDVEVSTLRLRTHSVAIDDESIE